MLSPRTLRKQKLSFRFQPELVVMLALPDDGIIVVACFRSSRESTCGWHCPGGLFFVAWRLVWGSGCQSLPGDSQAGWSKSARGRHERSRVSSWT